MIDGATLRRDIDVLPLSQPRKETRLDQLREHLPARDAHMFGIEEPYEDRDNPVQSALIRTVGATAATATLLVTFGALALPAAAFL